MSRLLVVGIGPGNGEGMTVQAHLALEGSELICGYTRYVDLVRPLYPQKDYLATGMGDEVRRCRMALKEAVGRKVALVCSGDPGVYGMGGLVWELSGEYPGVEIEIIPGVTAAQSGGAILGAPLMEDYVVISLSDLLIPWETIEKRLRGAALGGFVIVLYNPASHKRAGHLERACDILLESRKGDTVCGIVRNIGRQGEESRILTLSQLRDTQVDMFTTVFIGNDRTLVMGEKMITLRGYERKQ